MPDPAPPSGVKTRTTAVRTTAIQRADNRLVIVSVLSRERMRRRGRRLAGCDRSSPQPASVHVSGASPVSSPHENGRATLSGSLRTSTSRRPDGARNATVAPPSHASHRSSTSAVEPVEPFAGAHERVGGLNGGRKRRPAAKALDHDSARLVRGRDAFDLVGCHAPVAQAVGKADEVRGEAVPADVRALPYPFGSRGGQRRRDGPAERGAARVSAAVRADEVDGALDRIAVAGSPAASPSRSSSRSSASARRRSARATPRRGRSVRA